MIKTKQELLNHFSDINAMYNNPFMYQTLSNMIDELLEQQPAEDCVSREEVMKLLEKEDWADTVTGVLALPSVTPKTEWIPCSERLPEEDGCYLVTTTGTNNDIIDIAYYTEGIWHKASRIKAWMPLPKPYKEGDTDAD